MRRFLQRLSQRGLGGHRFRSPRERSRLKLSRNRKSATLRLSACERARSLPPISLFWNDEGRPLFQFCSDAGPWPERRKNSSSQSASNAASSRSVGCGTRQYASFAKMTQKVLNIILMSSKETIRECSDDQVGSDAASFPPYRSHHDCLQPEPDGDAGLTL